MWRLFLRIKCRFSALYNFIQNFQKKSVILVLICIKRYLKTHFEFNSEKVGFKKKQQQFFIFNFTSDCSDVISVGRDLVFWI